MEELKKEAEKHAKKLPSEVILARAEHRIPAAYENAWKLSSKLTLDIMEYRRLNRGKPSPLPIGDFPEEDKVELRALGLSSEEIDDFERKVKEVVPYHLSKDIDPSSDYLYGLRRELNYERNISMESVYNEINFIYEIFEIVDKGMYWRDIRLSYYTTGMYMHPAARAYFKKEGVFDIITAPL